MFKVRISGIEFDKFDSFELTLRYDSIASEFSMSVWFDPYDELHQKMFRPDQYQPITFEYNGKVVLTGTILNSSFVSSADKNQLSITGYSKTGVLEDCQIPLTAYPLHSKGKDLKSIAEKICNAFGINLIVDPAVANRVTKVFTNTIATDQQSAKQFLCEMAAQQGVIVSHDFEGNVTLTECKTNSTPLFDFAYGESGIEYRLDFDGQQMHSEVTKLRQAKVKDNNTKSKPVVGQANAENPYCRVFRPRVSRQTAGDANDTSNAARNALAEDLKGISVPISIQSWDIYGIFVSPNNIITIQNPYLYIYNKTRFFIESVKYNLDAGKLTSVLNCYLPEVYNQDVPKNIFE